MVDRETDKRTILTSVKINIPFFLKEKLGITKHIHNIIRLKGIQN